MTQQKQKAIPQGVKEIKPKTQEEIDAVWTNIDVEIKRQGSEIILPANPVDMSIDVAVAALLRRKKDEETEYAMEEFIAGAFWDAGLAFYKAMQVTYGWVSTQGEMGWFGRMRPNMITIKTGPKPRDVVQMPMGEFQVPNITNPINARPHTKNGVPGFQVSGRAKKAEQAFLIELCNLAREILNRESIYRGRAVRLRVDDGGDIKFSMEPEFIDLEKVSESDLIFNDDTQRIIETNLFTPMRQTTLCRVHNIPLKRGVLMEGPYGCGKSLTSKVAAKVAAENDWTFIALDRVQGLRHAIEFARLYQPAVIFAEDIDRIGDRSKDSVNDLVNLMDGILTKDVEIIIVLTTNHIERIDRSLLRPGRFDAVIRIDAPDQEAVKKLIRYYGGELIAEDADLNGAAQVLAGNIPATIREVVERSKLGMILDRSNHIDPLNIKATAVGMQRHLDLLSEKKPPRTAADTLADGLVGIISGGQTSNEAMRLDELAKNIRKMREDLDMVNESAVEAARAGSAAASQSDRTAEEVRRLRRNGQ